MRFVLFATLSILFFSSCSHDKHEKGNLIKMKKSFEIYIRDNDLQKNLITNLVRVEALSYIEIADMRESNNEMYETKIAMRGTTSYMNSSRVYNLNDTVTCYFDKNFKMLRLVNPNDN